jgi:sugar-specific transcriptional regulator TrmB
VNYNFTFIIFYVILTDMNTTILVEAGLTEPEANAYTFLVTNSPIAPPRLAELIKESRTNTYKLLESLEELGLAQKDESEKKIKYWAKNPSSLLQVVQEKKQIAELQAKKLESSLPDLVNEFLKHNEQPGVRFFQGKEGIKQIFADQIATGKNVTFVRSTADSKLYGHKTMRELRTVFAQNNIYRKTFSPDSPDIPINWKDSDESRLLTRTFMHKNDYTASVEWDVYGDKLAIISYGEEAIGMIIDSPQVAEGFKQLLNLVDKGLISSKDYDTLPQLANKFRVS